MRISDVSVQGKLDPPRVEVWDGDELVETFGNDRDASKYARGYDRAKEKYRHRPEEKS